MPGASKDRSEGELIWLLLRAKLPRSCLAREPIRYGQDVSRVGGQLEILADGPGEGWAVIADENG